MEEEFESNSSKSVIKHMLGAKIVVFVLSF